MPRLAANLSMMFTEVPFLDRFERAARAGFRGVEFLFPYDFDAAEIRCCLTAHQLTMVLFNLPPGNWEAGDRGTASDPNRINEFREGLARGLDYAASLGVKQLHCMAGNLGQGRDRQQAIETLVANLKLAAPLAADAGLDLLVEPINTYDMPDFLLNTSRDGIAVLDAVGEPNVKLQYDIYHMQRMEGELANTIKRLLPRIGHMQLADTPDRHEPGSGEINYPFLLDWIDRVGYRGWVGCEYRPAGATEAGLEWIRPYFS